MAKQNTDLSKTLKLLEKKGVVRSVRAAPSFKELQLAQKLKTVPKGDDWIFEAKFDGYRIEAVKGPKSVSMWSRNEKDWSHRFENVSRALMDLKIQSAIFDGEIVVLNKSGTSDFSKLQSALTENRQDEFVYYCFDLLELDGYDLRPAPLLVRKQLLEFVFKDQKLKSCLRTSVYTQGNGEARHREACRKKWEGIMAKDGSATYSAGRGPTWIKIKCRLEEEFVIAGFTDPQGARKDFGSLLLGYYAADRKSLIYAGRVGTGFTAPVLARIKKSLNARELSKNPFANALTPLEARGVHFTQPQLVAQIGYAEWTADRRLRQASFLGLREDKKPKEVTREA